jgi:hypothetical protein
MLPLGIEIRISCRSQRIIITGIAIQDDLSGRFPIQRRGSHCTQDKARGGTEFSAVLKDLCLCF